MARLLLDTNICIYIAKRQPPEVRRRFARLSPGDVAMSVITWGELCFGASKSQQSVGAHATLQALARLISVLPMSTGVGDRYGQIRASLETAGRPIGNNDLWIAAHALTEGLTVVTNNEAEFARVPGLKVVNWVAERPGR